MTTSETTKPAVGSIAADMMHAARYYLGNRRALLIIAVIAVVAGAALNWSWLVAIGVAPVLLTALPCLVMCGLGLCMSKMAGGSCASPQSDKAELSQISRPASNTATATNPLAHMSSCCGVGADTTRSTEQRKD